MVCCIADIRMLHVAFPKGCHLQHGQLLGDKKVAQAHCVIPSRR